MNAHVFVLGHRGMLGHVAARYFAEKGCRVETSPARYSGDADDPLIAAVRASPAQFVMNCLGRIKQKSANADELYRGNTVFPLHLRERMRADQYLIHASSDCVFSGTRGRYAINDLRDATDVYGLSKALGEEVSRAPNTTVLRVSIVGPELDADAGAGLLAWFLRQPVERPVSGYRNHLWNGITTLEWAVLVYDLIQRRERNEELPSLIQPGTEPLDKATLLTMFRDAFATRHVIRSVDAPDTVDRTLIPTDRRDPMPAQLVALARWYQHAGVAS